LPGLSFVITKFPAMIGLKRILIVTISLLLFQSFTRSQTSSAIAHKPESLKTRTERLQKDIPQLMKFADIPGMSAALINNGKLVWRKNFGVANAETGEAVTDSTIFEAASLTKIVTAYAALQLVDQGKLNLDTPLNKYLGNNYDCGNDERINLITARHVLTHSAGFPNWRPEGSAILPILFNPGEKFSYSGEGFVYLSKVIEKITAINFDDYVKQEVFDPLKMNNSSLIWLDSYKQRLAWRHDWLGNKSFRWEGPGYNAAASLRTTAEDYAKFVIAILTGKDLKKATWTEMLSPQIKVNEKTAPNVSWGLGLGLETTENGKTFWHWGDQGDSKCYMTALVAQKNAILYFTNSSNGLSIADTLLSEAIGGDHPSLAWLNYGTYNPSAKMFLQSVLDKGATVALKEYLIQREKDNTQGLDEGIINRIGYYLLRLKKVDDAIEVFNQNTIDFPESSNTWDSLAEAYMTRGNKELAIKYYEKSLELDPGNTNAAEQLKKLRS